MQVATPPFVFCCLPRVPRSSNGMRVGRWRRGGVAASYLQEVGRDRGSGRHTHKKRWRSGTARKQCSPSSPVVVDAIAAIYQSQRSKSCCSTVPTNFPSLDAVIPTQLSAPPTAAFVTAMPVFTSNYEKAGRKTSNWTPRRLQARLDGRTTRTPQWSPPSAGSRCGAVFSSRDHLGRTRREPPKKQARVRKSS